MKTTLLVIALFTLFSTSFAQEINDTSAIQVVAFPDVEAEFPGGAVALMKYITQNIAYPDGYGDVDIAGTIYVSFFVNTDGSTSEVKVEIGFDDKLNEMAKGIILDMPKWKPAEMDGKVVKSRIRLPIKILLD